MEMTQVLTFLIETVTKDGMGFETFAKGVELRFPEGVATQPEPKDWRVYDALREQNRALYDRLLDAQRGVCFTTIGRRREP